MSTTVKARKRRSSPTDRRRNPHPKPDSEPWNENVPGVVPLFGVGDCVAAVRPNPRKLVVGIDPESVEIDSAAVRKFRGAQFGNIAGPADSIIILVAMCSAFTLARQTSGGSAPER